MRIKRPIEQEQNPELWVPDGMPEFKVGDKVRWRISPECEFKCLGCGISFHAHCQPEGKGTIATLKGSLLIECASSKGSLYKCGTTSKMDAHTYQIEMDELTESDHIFWATASELIPLE